MMTPLGAPRLEGLGIGHYKKEVETNYFNGVTFGLYWGFIGIMEKKMQTTIVYWGYIRILEKNMATTIYIYLYIYMYIYTYM